MPMPPTPRATVSHSGDTNWTLVTANNIDADGDWDTVNNDDYIVRVYCSDDDTGGCSGNIANSKIHLNQFAGGGITDLEMVHQQINTAATDADATYTAQDYIAHHNPNLASFELPEYTYNYNMPTYTNTTFEGANIAYYYEATLKTSAVTIALIESGLNFWAVIRMDQGKPTLTGKNFV